MISSKSIGTSIARRAAFSSIASAVGASSGTVVRAPSIVAGARLLETLQRFTTRTKNRPFSSSSYDDHHDHVEDHNHARTQQHLPLTVFTEDEMMIREAVRQWSLSDLLPKVREMDDQAETSQDIVDALFAQGYMGMEIPVEYGGSELNFTSACLTVMEISRIDPSIGILVDIHNTLTNNAIRFWGSPKLQAKWLPRLATDCVSSFCLSEASSGSDAFSMKTTAVPSSDGSSYTLNGEKMWISNAKHAGVFLVFANTDPSKGYKGITAFVVDAKTPGITVGKPEKKLGLKASSTCPVVFENVQVDADDILGEIGQGYKYCIEILNEGRIGIAAQQVGIAQGCLDIALPYIFDRQQFGKPIGEFQGMQHQYAMAITELEAATLLMLNACRLKETGSMPFVKEASMAKLYASQVSEKIATKSIEWLGGIGFTQDLLVEKFYRDCKVGSIYEGTSNIQLQTIAKLVQQEYKK